MRSSALALVVIVLGLSASAFADDTAVQQNCKETCVEFSKGGTINVDTTTQIRVEIDADVTIYFDKISGIYLSFNKKDNLYIAVSLQYSLAVIYKEDKSYALFINYNTGNFVKINTTKEIFISLDFTQINALIKKNVNAVETSSWSVNLIYVKDTTYTGSHVLKGSVSIEIELDYRVFFEGVHTSVGIIGRDKSGVFVGGIIGLSFGTAQGSFSTEFSLTIMKIIQSKINNAQILLWNIFITIGQDQDEKKITTYLWKVQVSIDLNASEENTDASKVIDGIKAIKYEFKRSFYLNWDIEIIVETSSGFIQLLLVNGEVKVTLAFYQSTLYVSNIRIKTNEESAFVANKNFVFLISANAYLLVKGDRCKPASTEDELSSTARIKFAIKFYGSVTTENSYSLDEVTKVDGYKSICTKEKVTYSPKLDSWISTLVSAGAIAKGGLFVKPSINLSTSIRVSISVRGTSQVDSTCLNNPITIAVSTTFSAGITVGGNIVSKVLVIFGFTS